MDRPNTILDAARLDQILSLHDAVLVSPTSLAEVGARVCQACTLITGAAAARLVTTDGDGPSSIVASYGAHERAVVAANGSGAASGNGHDVPHVGDDVGTVLRVPVRDEDAAMTLEIRARDGECFGLRQAALARYVASVAAVALRQHRAQQRLARVVDSRSEVLIALAHDLRNPLNALIGYTQLLAEGDYGPCTDEQRGVLGVIERHATMLTSMLAGALDVARLEAQSETPRQERFSLDDVLRELCTSLAATTANGVRIAWSVDPAVRPPVRGDRFRVRQILQNLLDNAVRFTDHGAVSVDAVPHDGGVRLVVSDTGTGIDDAALPHLFEPFRSGGTERSGTGCGLYVVKRFSESLGGRVAVASTLGVGTRFTVDLPLAS